MKVNLKVLWFAVIVFSGIVYEAAWSQCSCDDVELPSGFVDVNDPPYTYCTVEIGDITLTDFSTDSHTPAHVSCGVCLCSGGQPSYTSDSITITRRHMIRWCFGADVAVNASAHWISLGMNANGERCWEQEESVSRTINMECYAEANVAMIYTYDIMKISFKIVSEAETYGGMWVVKPPSSTVFMWPCKKTITETGSGYSYFDVFKSSENTCNPIAMAVACCN